MDAQYKELQSNAKKAKPDLDEDDISMSREEEAKFMQTFRKTSFYNDYRDRDSNRDNWRSNEQSSYNRTNTDDKSYDLQKQFNDFIKSQQSTNAFAKETFMDLKTQLETVSKNHQASIQNLETKFDRLADKQSGRPSGSLPSNTQPNLKGHNSKTYQPPQACNEHVNAVLTSADLGASINLMPYSLYAKLSLKTLKPTKMSIRLADRSFQYPVEIAKNMLVEVGNFTFLVNFIILEMEEDSKVPLILGRPFLHTVDAVIQADEKFDSESETEEPPFKKITINIDYKIKTSLEEPPTDLELKPLPDNLEYVFLVEPSFLPVIISSQLSKEKKNKLVFVLKKHKQAFAWKTTNIPGICPSFCKHKIQLLDDKKPVVQKERRLNPNIQEVVKKEIIKILDTGIIYPIADSPWVSPIHYVPKKGGITVVTEENDELIPTRTITGWRVCIDYHKLNEATA
nr:DNA-directed DNA polymerase [Tanacetum cinerariifolium]